MRNSEQLEREAEQTRAQLAQTLDELRERITPGELVDQAVDYAKESGGGDFVRNLGRQMADNPLPVCLMGAGLAWLMLSNRRPATSDMRAAERVDRVAREARDSVDTTVRETRERVGETAQDVREKVGGAAASLGRTASSAYDSTKARAGSAIDAASEATSEAYEQLAEGASRAASGIASSASTASQSVASASQRFLQICTEEPLVLAGIGLAIGAVFGAAVPSTEAEDRLLGPSSDRVKERTGEIAQEQLDKGKAVATAAFDETRAQAEKQGLGQIADAEPEQASTGPTLVPADPEGSTEGKQKQRPFAEPAHGLE
jgi:ElaB/YqjD/DUF883 family membrane-anchored ribosome-binding protein